MRKLLLSLALALPLASQAQTIPNSGLETWIQRTAHESVADWYSTDDYIAALTPLPISLGFVTKSTDRQAGSFAAQLQSKQLPISFPGITGYAPGVLLLGRGFDQSDPLASGGVPFTSRPSSIRFWYKATIAANDEASAVAQLSRGPRATQETVGLGIAELSARSTYAQAEIEIEYEPASPAPDTLRLLFVAGNGEVSATTTLFIDDITLGAIVTSSKDKALSAALSVYPNPSSTGEFALASLDKPEVATAPLTVTDALGRVVYQEKGVARQLYNGRPLNLQRQAPGLYTLRLDTPNGPVTRRLVIQ